MISKKVTVINKQGLHMRPASIFVREMSAFESDMTIVHGSAHINAKSIMNLMAAGIKYGSEIELICEGKDEEQMMNKAVELVEDGFGE